MRLEIDVEKSVERKRLYPKSKLIYYSDYVFFGFVAVAYLYLIIAGNSENFINKVTSGIIIWTTIYLIVFLRVFYILSKISILTVLTIKDKKKAKNYIHALIEKSNWDIKREDEDFIIFVTKVVSVRERQVTIIFKYDQVFINVMTLGRNMKSIFHYQSDRRFLKSIIDKFNENNILQYEQL